MSTYLLAAGVNPLRSPLHRSNLSTLDLLGAAGEKVGMGRVS